jgi:ABC-type sulfate transport system permease subunit
VGATLLVMLLGLPTAYVLATRTFPGRRVLEVLLELPMVMPPTVAGLALLLTFGRAGLLGGSFRVLGFSLPFTTAAVVVAQAFMAAPFFLGPVRAGRGGEALRDVASTLGERGCAPFWVVLPLSLPSVVAGTAWPARRWEFGATIVSGNLPDAGLAARGLCRMLQSGAAITLSVSPASLQLWPSARLHFGQASSLGTGARPAGCRVGASIWPRSEVPAGKRGERIGGNCAAPAAGRSPPA